MIVNCPTCKQTVEWNETSQYRPFCSKKCQLIDLGEWADEEKSIPCGANKDSETITLPDIEDIEAMLSEHSDDFFKE
ncbi:DNA gyrase inhibitor YacG [Paraglaciecola aquimarina]|uniref:DNA gyrase inhibitor YacG n=1 Tax=Paraglaciecola algarum TaxID=3050085 RepID=A0ABS9D8I0_9ALTE|nr:DNA gyrase inhibitor YacG [Paraglaciecola sp. G1-23]MCF2948675.1 DNA gyrase inhibitor YacG [Paraglaciecola sp. G1-23]